MLAMDRTERHALLVTNSVGVGCSQVFSIRSAGAIQFVTRKATFLAGCNMPGGRDPDGVGGR